MADTTFIDDSTIILAEWMNDLNRLHYTIFGDPADLAAVKTLLFNNPAFVTPALGTPASGTLTNCTGLPVAGISGLGANVASFLATPSSANLAAAVTDESGAGSVILGAPGSWVPSICFGNRLGTTGITYSSQSGSYTKIGDRCFFDFIIALTSKGSSTGSLLIEPPVPAAAIPHFSCAIRNLTISGETMGMMLTILSGIPDPAIDGNYMMFQAIDLTTRTVLSDAHVANNSFLYGSGHFRMA